MNFLILLFSVLCLGLSKPVSSQDVPADDSSTLGVKYYLYTRSSPQGIWLVNSTDSLSSTDFSPDKASAVFVFGWTNNLTAPVPVAIRNAYLQVADLNMIIVDWSSIASQNYISALTYVQPLGKNIADFLTSLVDSQNAEWDNIILSGHSFGAQLAGVAGQLVGGLVGQVIGLDPAGPLFLNINKASRIDPSSGKFVEVIHTNAGLKGTLDSLGTADYWLNGGAVQPGCGFDPEGSCSHARAVYYFTESLATGNFIAKSCSSNLAYSTGLCQNGAKSWLGQLQLDVAASGNYYLSTNSDSPYAQGG